MASLTGKISTNLRAMSDEQDANAAVAVLLRMDGEKLCVLLVRRVRNPRDVWSGQMALPGGKRKARDNDLKETVIRETLEETNIDLRRNCRFLGVMSAFPSKPRPEIKVLPFVVLVEDEPSIMINRKELEEYFWISFEELVENRAKVEPSVGGFAAFSVRGTLVWGLTYRILEDLIRCFEA